MKEKVIKFSDLAPAKRAAVWSLFAFSLALMAACAKCDNATAAGIDAREMSLAPIKIELGQRSCEFGESDEYAGPPLVLGSYPTFTLADAGSEGLKAALDAYSTELMEGRKNDIAAFEEDARAYRDHSNGDMGYFYSLTAADIVRADVKIVSIITSTNSDANFPHPNLYFGARNFDAITGKTLTLADVVGNMDAVVELVAEELVRKYTSLAFFSKDPTADIRRLIASGDICFTVGTDRLTFYFEPYVLGPYSSGDFIAELQYDDYEGLIKAECMPNTHV